MIVARRLPLPDDQPRDLVERLRRFYHYIKPVYRHPFGEYNEQGMADLDMAIQLLTVAEFAEGLRTAGTGDEPRWGAEILQLIDKSDTDDRAFMDIRAVLVHVGAIAEDDWETDLPALLRALLS